MCASALLQCVQLFCDPLLQRSSGLMFLFFLHSSPTCLSLKDCRWSSLSSCTSAPKWPEVSASTYTHALTAPGTTMVELPQHHPPPVQRRQRPWAQFGQLAYTITAKINTCGFSARVLVTDCCCSRGWRHGIGVRYSYRYGGGTELIAENSHSRGSDTERP